MDKVIRIIGSMSSIMYVLAAVPQIIKIIKTKNTKDLSLITMFINLAAAIMYEIYTFYFKLYELFFPALVSICFTITQIVFKYRYDRKQTISEIPEAYLF